MPVHEVIKICTNDKLGKIGFSIYESSIEKKVANQRWIYFHNLWMEKKFIGEYVLWTLNFNTTYLPRKMYTLNRISVGAQLSIIIRIQALILGLLDNSV